MRWIAVLLAFSLGCSFNGGPIAVAKRGSATCFSDRADYAEAQRSYEEALALDRDNTYVLVARAGCYARQGLQTKLAGGMEPARQWFARALEAARRALQIDPSCRPARRILAEVYVLDGRPTKALEVLHGERLSEDCEPGCYAWRASNDQLLEVDGTDVYHDPAQFAEYVDRLLNPDDYGPDNYSNPDDYDPEYPGEHE